MLKEEHYKEAGIHFELAANSYKKAHEYHILGEHEKSEFEAHLAQVHHIKAEYHTNEIVKLNNMINSIY